MNITAVTVNYNTPELLDKMIGTFRKFYDIEIIVVDGSSSPYKERVYEVVDSYENITSYFFNNNIHHGTGLSFALSKVDTEQVLFIDSDVYFHKHGFVEDLHGKLRKDAYGIGDVQTVDSKGFNSVKGIKYLHPAFCLINTEVARQFSNPTKHGAPMIKPMTDIHNKKLSDTLLQHEEWVTNDFRNKDKIYLTHDWSGTVAKFGYNL